jgi:hypothetical protein
MEIRQAQPEAERSFGMEGWMGTRVDTDEVRMRKIYVTNWNRTAISRSPNP